MSEDNCIIRLADVGMRWDRRNVLEDVNLRICRGDFMAITGPNGGGKTTLLRIILKLLRPTFGRVTYFGVDGTPADRLSIGYLPQKNKIDSRFPITVREVVQSGLMCVKGLSTQERNARIDAMLTRMGLREHVSNGLGELSGGQMQRALLGRALISEPDVLVLDEPLSYVDKRFESRIYDILAELKGAATIILVSHEMSTIASMANKHVIVDGRIHMCHAGSHFVHYDCCDSADV
ncbi:MAG: metal ABC transporter ATP-binding protein [Muribaculaceae bacterium]|nr:metal ABC transporter ATP-binding protein [Muribaculaceae bacterium]